MYCFTVVLTHLTLVSSFSDGTTATSTCMAMEAAMKGPMPTWKYGSPRGIPCAATVSASGSRRDDGRYELGEDVGAHARVRGEAEVADWHL